MATNNSDLEVRITGKDSLSPELQKLESRIIRFVGSVSAALAGIQLLASPIKAASDFERELANVAKTTDFVSKAVSGGVGDLDRLSDSLLRMSLTTNVAATDLAKIAAEAGQQGLGRFGVEGVTQFTDSISRMASTLDIAAKDAANQMGKIVNIFKIPLSQVEHAVSVINEVSNKSTASGEELLDVIKRIGDAAGSLDLSQATALAATALDFGTSPEVAGTAFARMFSSATEKAEEFGDLMGESATGWVKRLKTDGLGAFKDFLARLRQLDESSQQKAIVKLVGGGRMGALLNKLVQDTTNSVLERNFQAALEGESGTSALREQAKVMNTLSAQATILHNSFIKLGIETSQKLLQPLTQYASQLSTALQTPEFKAFFADIFTAVGKTLGVIVDVTKAVADMGVQYDELGNKVKGTGINWANFAVIVKAFVGLKVAQAIQAIVKSLPGLSGGLKSVNAEFAAMTLAGKGGGLAKLFGLEEAFVKIQRFRAELKATKDLAATAASTKSISQIADTGAQGTARVAGVFNQRATNAGANVASARAAVAKAEAASLAGMVATQTAIDARIIAAQELSNARKLQIETAYQDRLNIIKATGTKVGLTELNREKASQLAQEEAAHARSLRSIEGYYAKRAVAQAAALDAEVLRARAALATQEAILATATTGAAAANAAAATATAAAATAAATAAAAAAAVGPKLGVVATGIARLMTALAGLGVGLRTVATFAVAAGRLILGSLVWITVLYTIADAFGWLDGLPEKFNKLTDVIGLTSAKTRQEAIEHDAAKEKIKNQREELEKLTEGYKKYINAKTGKLDTDKIKETLKAVSQTKDPELQQQKQGELAKVVVGLDAEEKEIIAKRNVTYVQGLKDREAKIEEHQKEVVRLERKFQSVLKAEAQSGKARDPDYENMLADKYEKAKEKEKKAIEGLKKEQLSFNSAAQAGDEALKKIAEARETTAPDLAKQFTPESFDLAQKYAVRITQIDEEWKKVKATHEAVLKAEQDRGTATAQTGDIERARMEELQAERQKLLKGLNEEIKAYKKMPGASPDVIASFGTIFNFIKEGKVALEAMLRMVGALPKTALTGELAPGARPESSGDDKWDPKKHEAAMAAALRAQRKLTRELKEEEIQAETDFNQEVLKTVVEEETRRFERGLRTNEAQNRLLLNADHAANQLRIKEKKRSLEELDKQEKEARDAKVDNDDPVAEITRANELLGIERNRVRVRGEIAVLEERSKKGGAIDQANAEALLKTNQDFKDKIASDSSRLQAEDILPATVEDRFKTSLSVLEVSYREFASKLRLTKDPIKIALADALDMEANVGAFKQSLIGIQNFIDKTFDDVQRARTRIDIGRQQGALTSVQAEIAHSDAAKAALPILEQQLKLMEDRLKALQAEGKVSGKVYDKQLRDIDAVRLSIQQLGADTDKIAKDMNKALSDNVSDALDKLTQYGSSLKDVVKGFLFDMAGIVKNLLLKNFVEKGLQNVGSSGSGGFGGFIQNLFGQTAGKGPTGAKGDAFHVVVDSDGRPLTQDKTFPVTTSGVEALPLGQAGEFGDDDRSERAAQAQESVTTASESTAEGMANLANSVNKAGISMDIAAAATGNFAPLLNRISDSLLSKGLGSIVSAATPAATGAATSTATSAVGSTAITTAATTAATAIGTAGVGVTTALGTTASTIGTMLVPLQAALSALVSAISSAAAAAATSAAVSVIHTGGIVGSSGMSSRVVHPMLFAGAPRYHVGGTAGIRPGEVPAILQKGEQVLTENQQSLVAAAMDSGKSNPVNIRNVLVSDPSFVTDVVSSAQGEKVLMSFITKNRMGIRQAIG